MRFDTATLTLTLTTISILIPSAAGGSIPRSRRTQRSASQIADATRRHNNNIRDGSTHEGAAAAAARALPIVDSDPTYEISFLSKNDDNDDSDFAAYEDEHPEGEQRRSNPHEASCFDVPTFALSGILGMYPPNGRCTHVRSGPRSVAITCYHPPDDNDDDEGKGKKGARSVDEMHEERKLQFLENCDFHSRPEMRFT